MDIFKLHTNYGNEGQDRHQGQFSTLPPRGLNSDIIQMKNHMYNRGFTIHFHICDIYIYKNVLLFIPPTYSGINGAIQTSYTE